MISNALGVDHQRRHQASDVRTKLYCIADDGGDARGRWECGGNVRRRSQDAGGSDGLGSRRARPRPSSLCSAPTTTDADFTFLRRRTRFLAGAILSEQPLTAVAAGHSPDLWP